MENKSDKFETSKKNSFFSQSPRSENFFMLKDSIDVTFPNQTNYRRLNDYDSNILEADAYKNVSDELFKLEYKISRLEEELQYIDKQIQTARDISNYDLIETLITQKKAAQREYKILLNSYNEKSLSARISESISGVFGFKYNISGLKEKFNKFFETILLKLPKPFVAFVELKKSLNKLENINKSVDELINIGASHESGFNKYEQLSKYIVKANNIQSSIKKYIKE